MSAAMEVPALADLGELSVDVASGDEPGVVSVTAWATDGAEVTITWDEVASSAAVVWQQDGRQVVRTERETVSRVSVSGDGGAVELGVWTGSDGVQGRLVVRVAEQVTVTDSLLRV